VLFDGTPLAWTKLDAWSRRRDEFGKRARRSELSDGEALRSARQPSSWRAGWQLRRIPPLDGSAGAHSGRLKNQEISRE
jgi:hypothetical protein